jgi:DNA repair exonuclease SbcCD ATPase subunit
MARERTREERGSLEEWKTRITQLEETLKTQQEERKRAEEIRNQATKRVAQAQAVMQQTQHQLTIRQEARNEAVCSRCGQPVNPEHMRRELEEAEHAVHAAQQAFDSATQHLKAAERQAKDAVTLVDDTSRELPQMHKSLEAAESAEREWEKARKHFQDAIRAAGSVSSVLLSSATDGSVEDASVFLHNLNTELKNVKGQLKQAEEMWEQASLQSRNAQQAHNKAVREQERLQNEAQRLTEGATALQGQAKVRLADIDPIWRERALGQDIPFLKTLAQRHVDLQGIDQRQAELQKAGEECSRLETRIEEIKRNSASVQPEHRILESEAVKKAEEVKTQLKDLQTQRDDNLQTLRGLKDRQKERRQIEDEASTAIRRHRLYKRLAELLGRNGLQSFLLDEAIQGIALLANETLARISGGQLRLFIERNEEEIAIRATDLAFSEEPLDVRFLSGSQKFRVSVALAAGIGQYAGRGVGSVRSLIIDEGFGSLDTQGRQDMIDELRNLSQLMDRLIIVSHQEDFQDRTLFPTGYVLRKIDQRTQVERFV